MRRRRHRPPVAAMLLLLVLLASVPRLGDGQGSPSRTPSRSMSPSASISPTQTPTTSVSRSPSLSSTPTGSTTPSVTPTVSATSSSTPTTSSSRSPSISTSPSRSASTTRSVTPTSTTTASLTPSPSPDPFNQPPFLSVGYPNTVLKRVFVGTAPCASDLLWTVPPPLTYNATSSAINVNQVVLPLNRSSLSLSSFGNAQPVRFPGGTAPATGLGLNPASLAFSDTNTSAALNFMLAKDPSRPLPGYRWTNPPPFDPVWAPALRVVDPDLAGGLLEAAPTSPRGEAGDFIASPLILTVGGNGAATPAARAAACAAFGALHGRLKLDTGSLAFNHFVASLVPDTGSSWPGRSAGLAPLQGGDIGWEWVGGGEAGPSSPSWLVGGRGLQFRPSPSPMDTTSSTQTSINVPPCSLLIYWSPKPLASPTPSAAPTRTGSSPATPAATPTATATASKLFAASQSPTPSMPSPSASSTPPLSPPLGSGLRVFPCTNTSVLTWGQASLLLLSVSVEFCDSDGVLRDLVGSPPLLEAGVASPTAAGLGSRLEFGIDVTLRDQLVLGRRPLCSAHAVGLPFPAFSVALDAPPTRLRGVVQVPGYKTLDAAAAAAAPGNVAPSVTPTSTPRFSLPTATTNVSASAIPLRSPSPSALPPNVTLLQVGWQEAGPLLVRPAWLPVGFASQPATTRLFSVPAPATGPTLGAAPGTLDDSWVTCTDNSSYCGVCVPPVVERAGVALGAGVASRSLASSARLRLVPAVGSEEGAAQGPAYLATSFSSVWKTYLVASALASGAPSASTLAKALTSSPTSVPVPAPDLLPPLYGLRVTLRDCGAGDLLYMPHANLTTFLGAVQAATAFFAELDAATGPPQGWDAAVTSGLPAALLAARNAGRLFPYRRPASVDAGVAPASAGSSTAPTCAAASLAVVATRNSTTVWPRAYPQCSLVLLGRAPAAVYEQALASLVLAVAPGGATTDFHPRRLEVHVSTADLLAVDEEVGAIDVLVGPPLPPSGAEVDAQLRSREQLPMLEAGPLVMPGLASSELPPRTLPVLPVTVSLPESSATYLDVVVTSRCSAFAWAATAVPAASAASSSSSPQPRLVCVEDPNAVMVQGARSAAGLAITAAGGVSSTAAAAVLPAQGFLSGLLGGNAGLATLGTVEAGVLSSASSGLAATAYSLAFLDTGGRVRGLSSSPPLGLPSATATGTWLPCSLVAEDVLLAMYGSRAFVPKTFGLRAATATSPLCWRARVAVSGWDFEAILSQAGAAGNASAVVTTAGLSTANVALVVQAGDAVSGTAANATLPLAVLNVTIAVSDVDEPTLLASLGGGYDPGVPLNATTQSSTARAPYLLFSETTGEGCLVGVAGSGTHANAPPPPQTAVGPSACMLADPARAPFAVVFVTWDPEETPVSTGINASFAPPAFTLAADTPSGLLPLRNESGAGGGNASITQVPVSDVFSVVPLGLDTTGVQAATGVGCPLPGCVLRAYTLQPRAGRASTPAAALSNLLLKTFSVAVGLPSSSSSASGGYPVPLVPPPPASVNGSLLVAAAPTNASTFTVFSSAAVTLDIEIVRSNQPLAALSLASSLPVLAPGVVQPPAVTGTLLVSHLASSGAALGTLNVTELDAWQSVTFRVTLDGLPPACSSALPALGTAFVARPAPLTALPLSASTTGPFIPTSVSQAATITVSDGVPGDLFDADMLPPTCTSAARPAIMVPDGYAVVGLAGSLLVTATDDGAAPAYAYDLATPAEAFARVTGARPDAALAASGRSQRRATSTSARFSVVLLKPLNASAATLDRACGVPLSGFSSGGGDLVTFEGSGLAGGTSTSVLLELGAWPAFATLQVGTPGAVATAAASASWAAFPTLPLPGASLGGFTLVPPAAALVNDTAALAALVAAAPAPSDVLFPAMPPPTLLLSSSACKMKETGASVTCSLPPGLGAGYAARLRLGSAGLAGRVTPWYFLASPATNASTGFTGSRQNSSSAGGADCRGLVALPAAIAALRVAAGKAPSANLTTSQLASLASLLTLDNAPMLGGALSSGGQAAATLRFPDSGVTGFAYHLPALAAAATLQSDGATEATFELTGLHFPAGLTGAAASQPFFSLAALDAVVAATAAPSLRTNGTATAAVPVLAPPLPVQFASATAGDAVAWPFTLLLTPILSTVAGSTTALGVAAPNASASASPPTVLQPARSPTVSLVPAVSAAAAVTATAVVSASASAAPASLTLATAGVGLPLLPSGATQCVCTLTLAKKLRCMSPVRGGALQVAVWASGRVSNPLPVSFVPPDLLSVRLFATPELEASAAEQSLAPGAALAPWLAAQLQAALDAPTSGLVARAAGGAPSATQGGRWVLVTGSSLPQLARGSPIVSAAGQGIAGLEYTADPTAYAGATGDCNAATSALPCGVFRASSCVLVALNGSLAAPMDATVTSNNSTTPLVMPSFAAASASPRSGNATALPIVSAPAASPAASPKPTNSSAGATTVLACQTAPGYGSGPFYWRVRLDGGSTTRWLGPPAAPSVLYAPPTLSGWRTLNPEVADAFVLPSLMYAHVSAASSVGDGSVVPAASESAPLSTSGGSLLLLSGTGFFSSAWGASSSAWVPSPATNQSTTNVGASGSSSTAGSSGASAGSSSIRAAGLATLRVTVGGVSVPDDRVAVVSGSIVLVYAPPGFGVVDVVVSLGSAASVGLPVPYQNVSQPVLSWDSGDLSSAARTVTLSGSGLSACLICSALVAVPDPTYPTPKLKVVRRWDRACSKLDWLLSLRGPCAKPRAFLGADVVTSEPGYPPIAVPRSPGFVVAVDGAVAEVLTLSRNDSSVVLRTTERTGTLSVQITGGNVPLVEDLSTGAILEAPPPPQLLSLDFDFASLLLDRPKLTKWLVSPAGWQTAGGTLVTLEAENAGTYGRLEILTPHGAVIPCLVTATTQIRDPDGAGGAASFEAAPTGAALHFLRSFPVLTSNGSFTIPPVSSALRVSDIFAWPGYPAGGVVALDTNGVAADNATTVDQTATGGGARLTSVWRHFERVPCAVTEWLGQRRGTGHTVTFRAPPLQGDVKVRLVVDGRATTETLTARYAEPAVTEVLYPARGGGMPVSSLVGGTAGSTSTRIRVMGTNLGVASNIRGVLLAAYPLPAGYKDDDLLATVLQSNDTTAAAAGAGNTTTGASPSAAPGASLLPSAAPTAAPAPSWIDSPAATAGAGTSPSPAPLPLASATPTPKVVPPRAPMCGGTLPVPVPAPSYGLNTVVLTYSGLVDSRDCRAVLWNSDFIDCVAPASVPGSSSVVTVTQFQRNFDGLESVGRSQASLGALFNVRQAEVVRAEPAGGPAAGGYPVTLRGLNLGKLPLELAAGSSSSVSPSPSFGSVVRRLRPDVDAFERIAVEEEEDEEGWQRVAREPEPRGARRLQASASLTPSRTPTRSVTGSLSISASPSITKSITPSPSVTKSISRSPSMSPSISRSPSSTSSVSKTTSASPSNTATVTRSSSVTRSISASPSNTPSFTPSTSVTPSVTPSSTISSSVTRTGTGTASATRSITTSPSVTPSSSGTRSVTPSNTPSSTISSSITASLTPSRTVSKTVTGSVSETPTSSVTPTSTKSSTPSTTSTRGASISVTPSITPSATPSSTVTPSASIWPTKTPSRTPSSTMTPSNTPTSTVSSTRTPSATASATRVSPSVSPTRSSTPSVTPSNERTPSPTPSRGFTPIPELVDDGAGGTGTNSTEPEVTGPPEKRLWRMRVKVAAATDTDGRPLGLVEGQSAAAIDAVVTLHTHSAVTFVMPVIEGAVTISLVYENSGGDSLVSTSVGFRADPPVLTSIATVRDLGRELDADPCYVLNATAAGDSNVTAAASFGAASGLGTALCPAAARATRDWGSFALDATRPCMRASLSSTTGKGVTLSIRGRNFGSGRLAGVGVKVGGVACLPADLQSIVASDDEVRCFLSAPLPRLDIVPVEFDVAFTRFTAADFGILPQAVCPCGAFAEADGDYCVPCPSGATCSGVRDSPRAVPNYWEVRRSEWLAERNFDPLEAGLPRFIPCAVGGLCLSDQRCLSGASGSMCTQCLPGYTRGYSGVCQLCDTSALPSFLVPFTLFIVAVLTAAVIVRRRRRRRMTTQLTYSEPASESEAGEGEGRSRSRSPGLALGRLFGRGGKKVLTGSSSGGGEALPGAAAAASDAMQGDDGATAQSSPWRPRMPVVSKSWRGSAGGRRPQSSSKALTDPSASKMNFRIALLKLVVTYSQTLAALAAFAKPLVLRVVLETDPQLVPTWLQGMQVATDFGLGLHAVKCSLKTDFFAKSYTMIMLPIGAVILLPLAVIGYASLRRAVPRDLPLPYISRKAVSSTASYIATAAVFFALPMAITAAARLQSCSALDAGFFLIEEPSVSCASPAYTVLARTAKGLGYLYLVVPIFAAGLLLARNRVAMRTLRFLTAAYRLDTAERWPPAWECVVLLRKALFVGIASSFLVLRNRYSQLAATTVLLALALLAHALVRPYESRKVNLLEGLSLMGALCLSSAVSVRLSLYGSATSEDDAARVARDGTAQTELVLFDTLSVLFNLPFICLAAYYILDEISCGRSGAASVTALQRLRGKLIARGMVRSNAFPSPFASGGGSGKLLSQAPQEGGSGGVASNRGSVALVSVVNPLSVATSSSSTASPSTAPLPTLVLPLPSALAAEPAASSAPFSPQLQLSSAATYPTSGSFVGFSPAAARHAKADFLPLASGEAAGPREEGHF